MVTNTSVTDLFWTCTVGAPTHKLACVMHTQNKIIRNYRLCKMHLQYKLLYKYVSSQDVSSDMLST